MRRKRQSRALGATPAGDKIMGVSKPLFYTGLLVAAGVAWANSGPGDPTTADVASDDPDAPATSGTTPKPSTVPAGGTKPVAKKKRPAIVPRMSPLTYVFVNSIGGEGIFDRLRAKFDILHASDGYGIDRIRTLDNGEFAGFATGQEWKSAESGRVYIRVVCDINNIQYNYWIEKSQTTAMHYSAAQQALAANNYLWGSSVLFGSVKPMSDMTRNAVASFYFNHYLL